MNDKIIIRGAREHNLKNIDVERYTYGHDGTFRFGKIFSCL